MASKAFKSHIEEVLLLKFGQNAIDYASAGNSVNILAQTVEVNIFESIFSPVIRGELVIQDAIGLFTNFPLTGEEIVSITYVTDVDERRSELMVIESIDSISISDDNRTATYIIKTVSIEAWANARRTVQKAYNKISAEAVYKIFKEYIETPLKDLLPKSYKVKPFIATPANETAKLWVIPNLKPFAAINMIAKYAEPVSDESYSYIFYQNKYAYHYETLQDMFDRTRTVAKRKIALENGYKYISDEIETSEKMSNENRLVTAITFNKRHSTLQKIGLGYFQNKLFEINMSQKATHITEWKADDVDGIEKHKLNTLEYRKLSVPIQDAENKEYANRVQYTICNQLENDLSFPVSQKRERWGKDLIERIALSQIDLTVTIPGDPKLSVGDLFHLELAEAHGFNLNNEDELISGFFIITEKRDTINQNGIFSTSLRIQKDSYKSTVDYNSKYKKIETVI